MHLDPTTTVPPTVPSRTTLAPLLRLFTLPPILTLPPPPTIDSYGINTIPELPPQHESIYAGMFAPDGSLIKKNTSTVKQTETNLIYDQETGQTGRERGARAAIIRALDERIADEDDHNLFDGEKVLDDREELKTFEGFLRQNAPRVETTNQPDASETTSEVTPAQREVRKNCQ
ncbi:unnamed protein product [Gongylonema pulchrum]|uniref:PRP21_like_P domain-containing protein n=1 Tax=Gongylonema pulchrum TaxID=637853 RepID=A0A183ETH4_9BILA|nr:unnamed protein product [Gongylonema pulchrum]